MPEKARNQAQVQTNYVRKWHELYCAMQDCEDDLNRNPTPSNRRELGNAQHDLRVFVEQNPEKEKLREKYE